MRIFAFFAIFLPVSGFAQDFGLDMGGVTSVIALATAVQKGVESRNYVFVAVLGLMFGLEILKIFMGSKYPSFKRNAAQYSAVSGVVVGSVGSSLAGGDPVSGALGGMMVGNAASGLYSSILKPVGGYLKQMVNYLAQTYFPLVIAAIGAAYVLYRSLKKSPREERKEILSDFDAAMEKVKDKENPSTKELESWLKKHF